MKNYKFKINGNDYTVGINSLTGNSADVVVNGTSYSVEIGSAAAPAAKPQTAAAQPSAVQANRPAPAPSGGGEAPVQSPLPGVILDIKVNVGDSVSVGQTLVLLEAMKMENNIDSDRAGVVKSIKVKAGDSVMEGDVLVTLG
jgi:biotin carboxyl carrier protein